MNCSNSTSGNRDDCIVTQVQVDFHCHVFCPLPVEGVVYIFRIRLVMFRGCWTLIPLVCWINHYLKSIKRRINRIHLAIFVEWCIGRSNACIFPFFSNHHKYLFQYIIHSERYIVFWSCTTFRYKTEPLRQNRHLAQYPSLPSCSPSRSLHLSFGLARQWVLGSHP